MERVQRRTEIAQVRNPLVFCGQGQLAGLEEESRIASSTSLNDIIRSRRQRMSVVEELE